MTGSCECKNVVAWFNSLGQGMRCKDCGRVHHFTPNEVGASIVKAELQEELAKALKQWVIPGHDRFAVTAVMRVLARMSRGEDNT